MRSSRKGTKVTAMLVALVTAALGLAACGDDGGSSSGGDAPKVAWLTAITTEFVDAEEKGARPVIEDAGGSLEFFDAQFDPQKQLTQCQDAITSGRFNSIRTSPSLNFASQPRGLIKSDLRNCDSARSGRLIRV